MGDMADMMTEGVLCAECGAFIDDEEECYDGACGYPRYCGGCGGKSEMNGQKPQNHPSRRRKKNRRPR